MSTRKSQRPAETEFVADLTRVLGVRRSIRLRRIMRHTGLPAEALIDLSLELLDIASRKLSPSPIHRTAVGLGAARWRNVSPEERSEALRRTAQARWAKHRKVDEGDGPAET
jgi:hypothetical protein